MRPKLHVRSGDTVEIVAGNSRGLRGRVLRAIPRKGKVVVEGASMVWKHVRPSRQHPRGGRLQVEASIDASNVMLICPGKDCPRYDKPVRTKRIVREDGIRIRACAKCGTEIPKAQ